MGCGSSTPATKDAMPIEEKQLNGTTTASARGDRAEAKTAEHISTKQEVLPTSNLLPIEFGLVKGWECGSKTAPALLVVQEWWGVNEDIKEKAMMLHQKGGCRVFIPDIYKGKSTVDAAEAKHMYEELDWPVAVQELIQAAEYLVGTGSPKVAAIGFCMGGSLAIAASQYGKIHAAVACYGLPQFEIWPPSKVDSPIQIHVGTKDDYVTVASAEEFASNVKGAGGSCELYIYEGAGHAFLNNPDKIEQPKASQKDIGLAWERIETFLWKHVGPNSGAQSSSQGMSEMQIGDTVSSSQMPDNMAGSSQDTATNGVATA